MTPPRDETALIADLQEAARQLEHVRDAWDLTIAAPAFHAGQQLTIDTLKRAAAALDAASQLPAYIAKDYQRLWDLVRTQRSELLDANLITKEEYVELLAAETRDKPGQGSPSPRRLEAYDELRARLHVVEQEVIRAARAYNESLDHLVARLRVVEQERDALKAVCEEARYCAVILEHAYRTDTRPPDGVLASVRAWVKEKA